MRRTFVAVGRIVGELREGRSLGADDLAAATGLAPSRVATIEAGEADPLWDEVHRLALALGVADWELLQLTEQRRDESC